jgi:hypothetical protein
MGMIFGQMSSDEAFSQRYEGMEHLIGDIHNWLLLGFFSGHGSQDGMVFAGGI